MKTIIAGSRDVIDYEIVKKAIENSGFKITQIVSGGARGVDRLGERYAKENNIPVKQFLPDWDKFGKRAGFMRNTEMANYSDACIAIWDGESRGTKHMIDIAEDFELHLYVEEV